MVGKHTPQSLRHWNAALCDQSALLAEQVRALREMTARVEEEVAATFERAARAHPDRATELESIATRARRTSEQLRKGPTPQPDNPTSAEP